MPHATDRDIEDIIDLCIEAHDMSDNHNGTEYDVLVARRNLQAMVGNPLFFIGYNGTGVLMAVASPSWFRNGYDVADFFFYAEKNGLQLIKEYKEWASNFINPEVSLGVTFGGEMGERTKKLYERMGMKETGTNFKVNL